MEIDSERPRDRPRMERRPEAASFDIEKLMQLVRDGRLRIPGFQRRFKWDNRDRIALLDSIERGYPIGTLLLWQRSSSIEGGLFEGVKEASPRSAANVYWVVDGQQRVTTLWNALARRPRSHEPCLCFDFDDESRFRFLPTGEAERGGRIPLHVVLDATELSEWLVVHEWSADRRRRAFELGTRIRQYSVAAYVVDTDDERVVRNIFDRTNATGKSLTRDEVFDALTETQGADGERKGIDRVNDRLAKSRFGDFDRATILNCLEAILELRVGKVSPHNIDPQQAGEGLDRTTKALAKVIDFLRESAHIPHALLVPYELPIVVLARFFDLFPHPAERSRVLLRRWLWRASLNQRLTGASGSLQEHIDDVKERDEHGSVQRVLARSGQGTPPSLVERGRQLSLGTALGRLQACALVGLRPRDLVTGEMIDIGEALSLGIDRAIRKIVNRPPDEHAERLARTIANRLIHVTVRGLGPARLIDEATDVAALASHGINEDAAAKLRRGDVAAFLEQRADVLFPWIERFHQRHAEWDADDSPPIAALRGTS